MSAPVASDLQALLTAAGLWNTAYSGLIAGYVAGAITQFQNDTGRIPFITSGNDSILYFDPPGDTSQQYANTVRGGEKILELSVPFVTISGIATGVSIDSPAGVAVDLNRAVEFGPDNYAIKGLPIEWIRFSFQVWGATKSIMITGHAGSYTAWPDDAFQAVVAKAAADLLTTVLGNITGGLTGWTEGDVKEDFGGGKVIATMIELYMGMYAKCVDRYRFFRVGI